MTRTLTEPTTALTALTEQQLGRVIDDAAELDEDEIRELLAQHDQRALLFGIAGGLLCGPIALVAIEISWIAPFLAAAATGLGGTIGQALRRRDAARALGVTDEVVSQVESQWTGASIDLTLDDLRNRRWRKLLFRAPREMRVELSKRIRARLVARRQASAQPTDPNAHKDR